ncbi:translation initiation factor eIF-2A [Clathrospora elynae]|uniref:Eukaryotic translation initiation factor 2A n=1 Tax=Clathrospora elynae TaxID=706981 RepID=A0A6A5T0V1_9PLEO|nr:translation initiation factor eIF-2A [Clathrospora elynae]
MAVLTQLAYRSAKGIGLFNAAPVYEALPGFTRPEGNLRCCCYSPDSKYFAWATPEQVSVIDASAGHIITTLPTPNVYELGFSPLGTYIITWQRPSKDEDGNATKNLRVWKTLSDEAEDDGSRAVIGEYVQKNQSGWNLQYTSDEKFCARVVTNEVQFFQSDDLRNPWNRLIVEGVTDMALSPGKNHSVAVFVPERKGMPAAVKVFQVPQFSQPVSQKTFYKGDKVQLKWNALGTSLIVLANTEVDKTNKSYYGETNMYILSANGTFDSRIQLDKEGPIHDVSWSPNSKEFGVTYGYMPAKTTIFNQRAVAQHSFDLGPRNTILFSPHGRFVIVAGFGNLAGDMDIYDLEKNFAKVCAVKTSNSTYCEWSPDGQHILTATTSPRLRVDNGIRIYHVSGGLMYNEDMAELYHVIWRPQPTSMHPLENPLGNVPTPHPSALAYMSTQKTPSKPAGAYRPPGARGTTTPLIFKREDEGGAAYTNTGISSTNVGFANGFGKPRRREVPGAEPVDALPPGAAPGGGVSLTGAQDGDGELSKAALKNKKKREAKKAREAADKAAGLGADTTNSPNESNGRSPEGRQRSRSKVGEGYGYQQGRSASQQRGFGNSPNRQARQDGPRQQLSDRTRSAQAPAPIQTENQGPPPDLTVTSPGDGNPNEKKIRGLNKKMRAIEELRMRQAGGEKLEDTQIKKIATEQQIKSELDALGYTG